jgi:tetratricopeptide (TPR) repeat protein
MKTPVFSTYKTLALTREMVAAWLILFLTGTASAQLSPKSLIDSATTCYTTGRYTDALNYYNQVLTSGQESADLYYNAGNAAFKANEMAQAVWYYEKALKLNPTDEDAVFNLGLANTRITDKIDQVPLLFYERWWKAFVNLFSPETWRVVSLLMLALTAVALLLFFQATTLWQRKGGFWMSMVFAILFAFSLSFAWKGTHRIVNHNEAIVFAATVTAKSSPDASGVDLFVLHEGTKVAVNDQIGTWLRVKIANGSEGWLEEGAVRRL